MEDQTNNRYILRFGVWPFYTPNLKLMIQRYNDLFLDYDILTKQIIKQRQVVDSLKNSIIQKEYKLLDNYRLLQLGLGRKPLDTPKLVALSEEIETLDNELEQLEENYKNNFKILVKLDKDHEKIEDSLVIATKKIIKYIKRNKIQGIPVEKIDIY